MKQFTLPSLTKERLIIIGLVALLLFVLFQCNSNSEQLGLAKKQADSRIENANNKINSLVLLNNYADSKIKSLNSKVDSIHKINNNLSIEKSNLTKTVKSKIDKSKNYNNTEICEFFINRYELPNEVKSVANGLELTENVSKLAIEDLIGGDGAIQELELTYKELINTQGVVELKDNVISQNQLKETNFNSIISEKDTIIFAKDEYNNQLKKSLRNKKVSNWIWKGATIIATTLLANEIIKK